MFKKDMEYLYATTEFGREPELNEAETEAVEGYAMKRSNSFTPMLR